MTERIKIEKHILYIKSAITDAFIVKKAKGRHNTDTASNSIWNTPAKENRREQIFDVKEKNDATDFEPDM